MDADIIIVDREDNPVGLKRRSLVGYDDIYRVSGLWLSDISTGDVLLARRKRTLKNDPGKWSAIGGTNEKDETYEHNMVKEIAEELGLKNLVLARGPKQFIDDGKHRFFGQWFLARVDKNQTRITTQEEELEGVRWVPTAELLRDVESHPGKYLPYMKDCLVVLGLIQV